MEDLAVIVSSILMSSFIMTCINSYTIIDYCFENATTFFKIIVSIASTFIIYSIFFYLISSTLINYILGYIVAINALLSILTITYLFQRKKRDGFNLRYLMSSFLIVASIIMFVTVISMIMYYNFREIW